MKSISLDDHFRKTLLELGYKRVRAGRFVLIDVDKGVSHIYDRTADGWLQSIETVVGVVVLPDCDDSSSTKSSSNS